MGDEADVVKGTTIEEPGGGYRLRQVLYLTGKGFLVGENTCQINQRIALTYTIHCIVL
jgi:hypothetical protein